MTPRNAPPFDELRSAPLLSRSNSSVPPGLCNPLIRSPGAVQTIPLPKRRSTASGDYPSSPCLPSPSQVQHLIELTLAIGDPSSGGLWATINGSEARLLGTSLLPPVSPSPAHPACARAPRSMQRRMRRCDNPRSSSSSAEEREKPRSLTTANACSRAGERGTVSSAPSQPPPRCRAAPCGCVQAGSSSPSSPSSPSCCWSTC